MNQQVPITARQVDYRARFSTAEFLRMAEAGAFDDMKVELVRAELERMNPPYSEHGRRQGQILIRLATLVAEDRLVGETGIDLGNDTVVACDAAVLVVRVADRRVLRPADVVLVVEVAEATASRDLGLKRELYAAAGIGSYWVIDSKRAVVHVYGGLRDDDYVDVRTVAFGDAVQVPGTDGSITID